MIKTCNLCSFPIIRINNTNFGTRCIKCRSTYAHRAIGLVINSLNLNKGIKVHEFSNHGAFLRYLKNKFTNVTTSEFFDDTQSGDYKNGILCQDLQNLTFKNESYDLLTSTEVFEHVPDDTKGFKEIYRTLKSNGHFVFTVPINVNSNLTIERAKIIDGKINHILEPEYHGDHLRNKGILSFRIYGNDIKCKLLSIGFSKVEISGVLDEKHSIIPIMHIIHCIK